MITSKYALEISDPFWTLFFTSRLVVRFVGGSLGFCLTDHKTRMQTILVVPVGENSIAPGVEEILRPFPIGLVGERHYNSAAELPIDFATVRRWKQLHCSEVSTRRRHVRILTHTRTSTLQGQDAHRLVFMNFWRAPLLQVERIRTAVGAEQIWYMDPSQAESRVLIHLKPGEEFRFRGETLEFSFDGVSHLVPVPNQGRTA